LQSKDVVFRAIEAADLIISVGFDMVEYHPRRWNPNGENPVVHIDFLPAEIDEHYNPDIEVIGDVAHAFWMLNERVARDGVPTFDLSYQKRARTEMQQELALHKDDADEGPVRPQKVLWDCRELLRPNDIVLSDVGAHKMWIARHYHCHEPNTCLIPSGFCSMGFALPGAISANLVHPDRRVLAICGDAGFLMNVQKMETARRLGSNIVVMVWEDDAYGLIAWKQEGHFGRRIDLSFTNPQRSLLAQSFGWSHHAVTGASEVTSALEDAFAHQGPSLVVVPIDYRENMLLTERLGGN
jgi:acetolactate synthase-1/2/3 large subunit